MSENQIGRLATRGCTCRTFVFQAAVFTVTGLITALPVLADQPVVLSSSPQGFATFIRGEHGGPIDVGAVGAPRNAAQSFRAIDLFPAHGHLFGVTDPAMQLIESHVLIDDLGWTHTSFQQMHRGVPVFSGVLKVHQDATGGVMAVNGRFYPLPERLSATTGITSGDAENEAIAAVEAAAPWIEKSELVIVDPGWYGDSSTGPKLAYHVIVNDLNAPLREAFFIDAHCGETLDQWSMIHTAKDRAIFDAMGGASIPGVLARGEGGPIVASPIDVNRAYDYYGDTYDFFLRAFGRDSIDGAGLQMIATVNAVPNNPPCPNAFWNGVQMVFCDGLVADDVVGHELSHGVTEYTAGLIYQNQSGQLNESYSDIFGELIDLYNGNAAFAGPSGGTSWPTHPTGPGLDVGNNLRTSACSHRADGFPDGVRWLMGEDVTTIANAIRDMWNPPCRNHPDFANSPLQTCPAGDGGGVHSGSGVSNHAFTIATDGKTFNGHTVTGIGPIKAGAIWYRALTTYLTPASDFIDAYYAIRQSALDLVGFDPNDPRTGLPSGSAITLADAQAVEGALLAVEMNTNGACGATDDALSGESAITCAGQTGIFFDDFENGTNGWTVSNSLPLTPYDWTQASGSLPQNRAGTAWFCADPLIGNCVSLDESGLHSLKSPTIPLGQVSAPFVSFEQFISTEGGWDGGNLKFSVNGGAMTLIPREAIKFNPFNGVMNDAGEGNTNPMAGQAGWTGSASVWGKTVVDLRTLVTSGDSVAFQFDFGKDGCNGALGWYIDNFAVYDCPDCDGTNGADVNQLYFSHASAILPGVGDNADQSYTIVAPPPADEDVVLTFNARGDFAASNEFCNVFLNGESLGRIFQTSAGDCPGSPESESMIVPAATWNAAIAGGDALIELETSPQVDATPNCNATMFIAVYVRYALSGPVDCDGNEVPDACQYFENGVTPFVNALLGNTPYDCVFDFNADAAIDGQDVQPYVKAVLGS